MTRLLRTFHYLSFVTFILSALLRIQHWPYGGVMTVVSIVLSLIVSILIAVLVYKSTMTGAQKWTNILLPLGANALLASFLGFKSALLLVLVNAATLYFMKKSAQSRPAS